MDLTIKDDNFRFGVRVSCLIFNKENTKVLIQLLNNKIYMFQGGRVTILEDSLNAIKRELNEELGLNMSPKLRYTSENFILLPNGKKYHELGFYYIINISERKIPDNFRSLDKNDGSIIFKWIDIKDIDKYSLIPNSIVAKIKNKDVFKKKTEHLINQEF